MAFMSAAIVGHADHVLALSPGCASGVSHRDPWIVPTSRTRRPSPVRESTPNVGTTKRWAQSVHLERGVLARRGRRYARIADLKVGRLPGQHASRGRQAHSALRCERGAADGSCGTRPDRPRNHLAVLRGHPQQATMSYPSLYTFVIGGVAVAVEQAKHVAGDKVVGLHGATVMQQALPLGLVDEIRVHVIPVLLGGGTPLFASLDSAITLERTHALATPAATHIRFRVGR